MTITIKEFLDHNLSRTGAVRELQDLSDHIAQGRALDDTLRDLRVVVAERKISAEDHRRLHLLLSQLYHAHPGLDGPMHDELRSLVIQGFERGQGQGEAAAVPST